MDTSRTFMGTIFAATLKDNAAIWYSYKALFLIEQT